MATSSDQQVRPIFTDKEHYFKALTHFTSKSDNLEVIQSWVDSEDFGPAILDKMELLLKSPEDELRMLGVGSGSGDMELIFLKKLLTRLMNIEACVLEPCRDLISKYQDLVDANEKDLEGIEYEWRQQSLEEYGQTCRYFEEGPKFHFISVVHSIYYVNELESALKLLHGMLEPGGALLITIVTEDTGLGLIWKTFPDLVQPTAEEGAASGCPTSRPNHRRNSTQVKEALNKLKIEYTSYNYTVRTDIGSCLEDQSTPESHLVLDFLAHTVNFHESAPEKLQEDFLKCLKEKCVELKDGISYFLNKMDVFVIYG
ncbi:histamine N-methyltransferase-like [Amphiura filiformis]|uniref:histamine N-methyltransferase-like n=1 Tax=Amphiura filiformis TaxID=82378 RepID=UPI003B21E906